MGIFKHEPKLPPLPSDEELAALKSFNEEHPDPHPTGSEVAEGEPIIEAVDGFGSPTYTYGHLDQGEHAIGVDMIEDGDYVARRRRERERDEREGR